MEDLPQQRKKSDIVPIYKWTINYRGVDCYQPQKQTLWNDGGSTRLWKDRAAKGLHVAISK
jgi:hypothetical protein